MESNNSWLSCKKMIDEKIDLEFYKVLFDPVRIEIFLYLVINGQSSIKDIAQNFKQDRSVISRHLDLMHTHKIVKKSKQERFTYYIDNKEEVMQKFESTTYNLKELMALNRL